MPAKIVVSAWQLDTMRQLRGLGLTNFQVGMYCDLKIKAVVGLLGPSACRGNPGNMLGREMPGTTVAAAHPTARDIEWAAGFIEGEGHFNRNQSQVNAAQVNLEPLHRLKRLFGGSILAGHHGRIHNWYVSGSRARGVMMTLYPLLSARRQRQVRISLGGS